MRLVGSPSLRGICGKRHLDWMRYDQGICQTAIKKVCRRLGIMKWPYKEMRSPTERLHDKGDDKGEAADNSDAARFLANSRVPSWIREGPAGAQRAPAAGLAWGIPSPVHRARQLLRRASRLRVSMSIRAWMRVSLLASRMHGSMLRRVRIQVVS